MNDIFKTPSHVPTVWMYWMGVVCFFMVGSAFTVGLWVNKLDSQVLADAARIDDILNELRFRVGLRKEIIDKLDDIQHRLSTIEGKLAR